MARMLGRYESPGCCPGSRQGWERTRRGYGPDCSGAVTDARRRKRIEQRATVREIELERDPFKLVPITTGADVVRDCVHGCDGECELYGGPSECGLTCHPGALVELLRSEEAAPAASVT